MRLLVTGSSGLVGSEVVRHFASRATRIVGLDNNQRKQFFGIHGDTSENLQRLESSIDSLRHVPLDIRDAQGLSSLFEEEGPFDLIVHCAAQPSHDWATNFPRTDFFVNAVGTLNLLEQARQTNPDTVFVLLSTNKVYGDAPNELPLVESPTRWDYARREDFNGVSESMRIDRSLHSLFGVSKVAADLLTQEYGRLYGMKTACLRCGCITGAAQASVCLHGFLSYLVRTQVERKTYQIFGYRGKQVRDNIHACDVATAIEQIYRTPPHGEVFNLGGGRDNSCSIHEAMELVSCRTGLRPLYRYSDEHRTGDHICYITNLDRFRQCYPDWSLTRSLDDLIDELLDAWSGTLRRPTTLVTMNRDSDGY